jgi:hypothetical protein
MSENGPGVGVIVGVLVGKGLGVNVGVSVAVDVGVNVSVGVKVRVAVGVALGKSPPMSGADRRLHPLMSNKMSRVSEPKDRFMLKFLHCI